MPKNHNPFTGKNEAKLLKSLWQKKELKSKITKLSDVDAGQLFNDLNSWQIPSKVD